MKRFLILNGPNINFTGIREVGVYGAETYASILDYIRGEAERLGAARWNFTRAITRGT